MAETSGPRGPCTAPRRRCCPAWRWTATAWAQPRPDACLPRACRARCRPGSTWLVSISTRTRVSALRRAPAHACPPGILGREAPEILMGLFPGVRDGVAAPPFLGRRAGVRAVSAPGAGGPLGPRQRPVRRRRRRAARGCAASPSAPASHKAHSSAGIGATRGDCKPRAPAAEAGMEFPKSGREKEPAPHPLRSLFSELESVSWQTPLPAAVGRSSVPSSAGSAASPERPGVRGGRRPQPWDLGLRLAGAGPRKTSRTWEENGDLRTLTPVDPGPGAPLYSGGKAGARRGGDAETGPPPSRSWGNETARERIGSGRGRTLGLTSSRERRRPTRPDSLRHFRRGAAQARGGRRCSRARWAGSRAAPQPCRRPPHETRSPPSPAASSFCAWCLTL